MALATFLQLAMDATDPTRLAAFWASVLGWDQDVRDDGSAIRLAGTDPGEALWIERVPEPRTVTDRVHLDLTCDDVPALVAHGATILRSPDDDIHWHVLVDPWGNEFCAFGS